VGELDGRVAIITGAGRGIGREHALLFAAEGAAVVAVDLREPGHVIDKVIAAGGRGIAVAADVANWDDALRIVAAAVDSYGSLHVLVNNAGLGPQSLFADMTEEQWDDQIRVNLKGTFCPTRAAVRYWTRSGAGATSERASVISTTSGAGLLGNPESTAYGAAKAGVAAMTMIASMELVGSGIRLNAVAPAARTPMSGEGSGSVVARLMRPPADPGAFDAWHPGNISPLVAYLATEDCPISGEVFHVRAGVVGHFRGWTVGSVRDIGRRWTIPELRDQVPALVTEAPDRQDAGGAAYASLRAALRQDRLVDR
jgi:NAD(P)-dependent dehydrogenase (short-subunit alcohol dehydrogenase family)